MAVAMECMSRRIQTSTSRLTVVARFAFPKVSALVATMPVGCTALTANEMLLSGRRTGSRHLARFRRVRGLRLWKVLRYSAGSQDMPSGDQRRRQHRRVQEG